MTRTVLLNNVDHHDLRIVTRRGAAYGDDVMFAVTFPDEFRHVQAHYPIVFRKVAGSGTFEPVALFGFQEGQNLFLGSAGWEAIYVPLAIERLPFFIGMAEDDLVVHVDLDSPRVGRDDGEPVFLPHGGTTEFLERMNSVLLAIHQGLQGTPAFIEALLAHDLLEPFVLEFASADGAPRRLAGFYTVNEERLNGLDGPALQALARAGHLQAAYLTLASLSQLRGLIDRYQRHGRDPSAHAPDR